MRGKTAPPDKAVARSAQYNVWRALSGAPQDVPLGLCAYPSLAREDLLDCDAIFDPPDGSACPTGALTDRKSRGLGRFAEVRRVKTTCSYCGTGCNFFLKVRGDKVIGVDSDYDAPVNKGNLCIKGRYGYDFIHSKDRITTPLIKEGDGFREASWDEALELVAGRFNALIKEYGADTVGGFSSSRCTNEENYLLAKWVRTAVGSNNVDNCARV
jgi:formate dehydrogenase alpha subunit